MEKKIGPLLLSGLMIGPILGSGIVLLPPLAYGRIGGWSIWAWVIIMVLGVLFAISFSKLTILKPGDGGMTNAIQESLGNKWRLFAGLLMSSAVLFGPTAVMLTAAEYLTNLHLFSGISVGFVAISFVILAFGVLLKDLKFISTLSFIMSSAIALILIWISISTLLSNGIQIQVSQPFEPWTFGRVILLLFWAIIGWEIVGNYSANIKDVKRTVTIATAVSLLVITVTYILVALAIQTQGYTDGLTLLSIVAPIVGSYGNTVMAILVVGLCLCTYLLIVGAVARLLRSLSTDGYLPVFFKKSNGNGVPMNAVVFLCLVHIVVLSLNILGVLDVEGIVSIANGFFVANAIVGLVAVYREFNDWLMRLGSGILISCLSVLLAFSSLMTFIALVVIYIIANKLSKRDRWMAESVKL